MHRMRDFYAKAGLTLVLTAVFGPGIAARADLLRPNATQSFPDLAGDIVGSQSYAYDPDTGTGLFVVRNAPSLIAMGPQQSSESFVNDLPVTPRSETIQVKLDSGGHLVNDKDNSFSVYGSVTIDGKNFTGLLLQGTPTGFGWAAPQAGTPTVSNFDLNVSLTGGLLQNAYGPDAYIRVSSELGSTFQGVFSRDFLGLKTMTNVRAYHGPNPSPVPEPSTFAIILACGGAGLLYHQRRRIDVADLTTEE
ncbi:MAG: PEP-CTERM sorting domain-containing protein [Planctomycetia bacterium]|nr:PEP-CTERM sorting domain-containing protein [Planctomycetia bacterium]